MIVPTEKTIDELFWSYKKTRRYLIQNLTGIYDKEEKSRFIDSLMLQMFVLWYLQREGFFNNDKYYFITRFNEINQKKASDEFDHFYDYFIYFLEKASQLKCHDWHEDKFLGRIHLVKPAIFLIDSFSPKTVHIPDKCFYQKPEIVVDSLPLLNLFQNVIFAEDIDDYILGAIYEKLTARKEKKRLGVYYTPRNVTNYTCRATLEVFLVDSINKKFNCNLTSLDYIFKASNGDLAEFLFHRLKRIKILDPAVGAGHFVLTLTKFLLELYVNIWKSNKKSQKIKNIEIIILDKHGEPKIMDIFKIHDENQFRFYVTYFIIFPKNIYGIDINEGAIRIAKARLFILLAGLYSHCNDNNISLQDIFLNLKVGNALLGFYQLNFRHLKEKNSLEYYIKSHQLPNQNNSVEMSEELRIYIEKAKRELNMNENLIKSNDEMNKLLEIAAFNHTSFQKVFNIINMLSAILLVTSNILVRVRIQSYLYQIKNKLIIKFNEIFSKKYNITMNELLNLKIFHWILEFSVIFSENPGFDIILANPPYRGESGNKKIFRIYAKALKKYYEGKLDLWYLFLQRSIDLMSNGGYSSFISSNYWVTAKGAEKLRFRLYYNTSIIHYINFNENRIFSNAQGIHTNIITFKKSKIPNKNVRCTLFHTSYPQGTDHFRMLNDQSCFIMDQRKLLIKGWDSYFHFLPDNISNTIHSIIEHSLMLKKSGFYVKEGIVTGLNKITKKQIQKFGLEEDWMGIGVFIFDEKNLEDVKIINSFSKKEKRFLKPFYKNSDIQRFSTKIQTYKKILYLSRKDANLGELHNIRIHLDRFHELLKSSLDNPPYINRPRSKNIFISPKIVTPQRSRTNIFAYNSYNWYAAQDVYYILDNKNRCQRLKSLLLLLNSRIAYFWFRWMGKRKGNQLEMFGEPLGYFPIPNDFDRFTSLGRICDYLLFLTSINTKEAYFRQIKEFFDKFIVNYLIIELYFKRKLYEDGFYTKNDFILCNLVLDQVEEIKFDKWLLLYYKKSIGKKITSNEKLHINLMETQITESINESYQKLKNNAQIHNQISKIKNHPIVKEIFEKCDENYLL